MENNMIYSLTINERSTNNITKNDIDNIDEYFNRKHILTKNDIKVMIEKYYFSEHAFLKGISTLTYERNIDLSIFPWFKFFKENIHTINSHNFSSEELGNSYVIRFLIPSIHKHIKGLIDDNHFFSFTENFVESCIFYFLQDMSECVNKTLVQDLHNFKKEHNLLGSSEESRYHYYLKHRFKDEKSLESFFSKYPVLLRIIWQRTLYFKKNIENIINRMDNNLKNFLISNKYKSFKSTNIKLGAGDTHDRGQTVAIIDFDDNKSIVYKPKNLEIVSAIDTLMSKLNEIIGEHFYIPKRLIEKKYTFEEFIEQKPVKNKEKISEYYFNYGVLIGFSYILKGTDFHYENIIAHKQFPVLIDLETFFQQSVPLNRKKYGATSQLNNEIMETVLGTSLLPLKLFRERTKDRLEGLNYSGLSIGGEKAPFNILQLVNIGKDTMKYEYKEFNLSIQNNLPTFQDKRIAFDDYKNNIYSGFKYFLNNVLANRNKVISLLNNHFQCKYIRHILRPTQQYTDILNFSYHPKCMMDNLEREKILQNLWSYSFTHKDLIKFEMNDIFNGDIPQFFINTSDTNIYTNSNVTIQDVFHENTLNLVKERILNLDIEEIEKELKIIKVSLQDFHIDSYIENSNLNTKKNFEKFDIQNTINNIALDILERGTLDTKTNTLNFIDIIDSNDLEVSTLSENLYDGLSGIYLFLVVVDYINNDSNHKKYRNYLKNTIKQDTKIKMLSLIYGEGSLIFPLLVEYSLLGSKEAFKEAEKIINNILLYDKNDIPDWIMGNLNLCPILNYMYKITGNIKYLDSLHSILHNIDPKQDIFKNNGSNYEESCGYYAMSVLNENNDYYIKKYIEESIIKKPYNFNDKDSYQNLNIDLAILNSTNRYNNNIFKKYNNLHFLKTNNTLQYGNGAILEILLQLEKKGYNCERLKIGIINNIMDIYINENRYNVKLSLYKEKIGLFTGISGVGYQLARYLNPNIPSVFLFEI